MEIEKGTLLIVKTPPYFTKEYFYEVTSAGEKLVRASLYHSPRVKKSWKLDELEMLIEHGIIRIAKEDERPGDSAEVPS